MKLLAHTRVGGIFRGFNPNAWFHAQFAGFHQIFSLSQKNCDYELDRPNGHDLWNLNSPLALCRSAPLNTQSTSYRSCSASRIRVLFTTDPDSFLSEIGTGYFRQQLPSWRRNVNWGSLKMWRLDAPWTNFHSGFPQWPGDCSHVSSPALNNAPIFTLALRQDFSFPRRPASILQLRGRSRNIIMGRWRTIGVLNGKGFEYCK